MSLSRIATYQGSGGGLSGGEHTTPNKHNVKIYTDWANHYLEKARHKRCITDLQVDITDGVLLADVIQAVTNEKVGDIKTKPRSSLQMVENINNCLLFLDKLGVNVEGLNAKEIKDGNLKAILGLFFSLSRFKQQQKTNQQQQQQNQKQQQQQHQQQQQKQTTATTRQTTPRQPGHTPQQRTASTTNLNAGRNLNVNVNQGEMLSRLPSPFNKTSNKCPTVAHPNSKDNSQAAAAAAAAPSNLNKQKSSGGYGTAERARQNNNSAHGSGGPGAATKNNNSSRDQCSSRSTSPSNCASGIPTPGGRTAFSRGQSVNEKHSNRIVNSTSTSSASSLASSTKSSSKKSSSSASEKDKNSMLDKFKFFNSKKKKVPTATLR